LGNEPRGREEDTGHAVPCKAGRHELGGFVRDASDKGERVDRCAVDYRSAISYYY
jgi:hypothetical protein